MGSAADCADLLWLLAQCADVVEVSAPLPARTPGVVRRYATVVARRGPAPSAASRPVRVGVA